jgi:hypothetical protein
MRQIQWVTKAGNARRGGLRLWVLLLFAGYAVFALASNQNRRSL